MEPLLQLGQVVTTPGAMGLAEQGVNLWHFLVRHQQGDWGDLSHEDKLENDYSKDKHLRILSAYNTRAGRLWIITEADRSATTFLLPEEY